MTVPDASETSQTEGEGPDSSDKPPHDKRTLQPPSSNKSRPKPAHKAASHGLALDTINAKLSGKGLTMLTDSNSIPLPSPEAGAYPKEPGHTRSALEKLMLVDPPREKHRSTSTLGSGPPSVIESPSPSESESWSAPSTRPPSQAPSRAPSRAPSMSGGVSGGKVAPPAAKATPKKGQSSAPPTPLIPASPAPRPRAPSVVSNDGSHKFNLKDLLSGGPKLARKSSNRSTGSSKKSDSDGGDAKSNAGSATSLSKKYGVCQKLAIGKGATSVVRLAHKWDRSEEKLYAVKVSHHLRAFPSLI